MIDLRNQKLARWGWSVLPAVAVWAIATLLTTAAAASTGPVFSAILSGGGQDYATSVASDAQGNTYVTGLTYSPDFPVTAGVAQTRFGGTCDAFIAKLGPDGKVIWATYLGGILDDWATGVALDSSGNVLVAGWTRSPDFPLVHPIQNTLGNGFRAFVAKLDPTGARLLYSTFLGGQGQNGAAGIVLDSAGNAYVAVSSTSATGFPGTQNLPDEFGIFVSKLDPQGALVYSFFHPNGTAGGIAMDAAGAVYVAGSSSFFGSPFSFTQPFYMPGSVDAMVFKISPDGSKKIYETTLGGSVQARAAAVAVSSAGEVWVAGSTSSTDFPLVKPLQSSPGARPLWKSTDGAATWAPIDDLPFALPQMMVVDPTNPATLYAASGDLGVFKSLDGGATWTKANNGIAGTNISALAIDPVHPQTLYASLNVPAANGGSSGAVYRTVNGATSWTLVDSPSNSVPQIAVDAQNSNIVWEIGANLRKSTDAGATWKPVAFPGPSVVSMALDPNVSGHLFATSSFIFCSFNCTGVPTTPFLYRSVDGGANWIQVPSVAPSSPVIVDGSTNPSAVYDGLAYRSVDGGVTWSPITPPPGTASNSPSPLALDPIGTLYAAGSQGIFVSHDHAQTWTALSSFNPGIISLVPAGSTGTLFAPIKLVASSGFVSKLSADGSTLEFSTYLRGHASLASSLLYAAEPDVFTTRNWISAIVLDAAGNATVAGGTRAVDLPAANPAQAANAGLADAFVTTISADGSKLNYSTYFGGSHDDGALAAALDSQRNVILAGQTWSGDFPVPGGAPLPFSYGDAFVVKLAPPAPPAIASVLNGASFQPGIEAGSWVTIKGANLANTNPGRTWRTDEVVNGAMPTSLDGVSVTINGKPAFVYYISPTQINVQAPSDPTTGPVNVVVNNNGALGAPGTAQLQDFAPAFFALPNTSFVVASRLPDYALIADPAAFPGAVAAKPGDFVALWGTGFGATNPSVPAGLAVSGVPSASTPPAVTVGGVQVPVIGVVLTAGCAGLYQVTIQLPDSLPPGVLPVQASVSGFQSPAGVTLYVAKP